LTREEAEIAEEDERRRIEERDYQNYLDGMEELEAEEATYSQDTGTSALSS